MRATVKDEGEYLLVTCSGEWIPADVTEICKLIKQKAEEHSQTKILVDWLNVSAPKMELDRFRAGEDVARLLRNFRIATIYPAHLINKFAENTAVNRGAQLYVTHNKSLALQWLLEGLRN